MTYLWMFWSWVEDKSEERKLLEDQGILIGSFSNPEAARKMLGKDGMTVSSTDEEFEATTRMIKEENAAKPIKKRKKRKLLS